MTTTTVRPDSTPIGASNFAITGGSATIHAALSDNSDSTYVKKSAAGNGTVTVGFGTFAVPGSERIKQVRIRARAACPTSASRLSIIPMTRVNGVNYSGPALTLVGTNALATFAGAYFTSAPDGRAWDQDRIDGLRAQILDSATGADLSSIYELYFDVVTTTQPSVNVTAPTGTITATSLPEVGWDYTDADGTEQEFYRIRVFTSAQYTAGGFDPSQSTAVWDSGLIASNDNTATIGEHLLDGTYRAYMVVAKTVGGQALYSGWDYSQFVVDTTPPGVPTFTSAFTAGSNRVDIQITGQSISGSFDAQVFQVQRSDDNGVTWADVTGASAVIPSATLLATVYDYAAPRAATAQYRVRSIGTLAANEVASAWAAAQLVAVTNDGTWWLKAVTSPTLNKGGVTVKPGFSTEPEEQIGVFRPIGRVSAVTVAAALQGEDGKLTIVTTASDFAAVWALVTFQGTLLLQSPEPTQKYIRIVKRPYTRQGLAGNPLTEITVEYVAVNV